MAKTVFVLQDAPPVVKRYLDALDHESYSIVGGALVGLLDCVRAHVKACGVAVPFAFLAGKEEFFREESSREIAATLAGAGAPLEPVFLVVSRSFSAGEAAAVLQRGNLFVLPRSTRANGSPAGLFGFKAALDKVFVDYEYNRRLTEYVTDDLHCFVEREELRSSKEQVERINQQLSHQNRVDELTKLLNRKGILDSLRVAKGRAGRERWRLAAAPVRAAQVEARAAAKGAKGDINEYFGHLSCMMIDIDHFKKINDTYGHLVGDRVLRCLGELFQKDGIFRSEDVCGRYGGEEFFVILPATSAENAYVPAEKFRNELKRVTFSTESGEEFRATVSIGIAELSDSEETVEEIIGKADAALYRAKEDGRDRTIIWEETSARRQTAHAMGLEEEIEELGGD